MSPSHESLPPRIDRRVALKWISAAAATPALGGMSFAAETAVAAHGYGPDPDMTKVYQPGELWPLTFSEAQRKQIVALCDILLPATDAAPGAVAVGVPDFLDEWISSPYPGQVGDRKLLLKGLAWLDEEARRRGAGDFVSLKAGDQLDVCQRLAIPAKRTPKEFPGSFFLRLRDLVAGGYYTTPDGMRDLGYRGNVPSIEWTGPPAEVLEKLGLSPQA